MAYIAEYSLRPKTAASKMTDNVSEKEKIRRREILTKVLMETSLENSKKYLEKEIDVLVSEHQKKKDKTFCLGKTRFYKTVKFPVPSSKFQDLMGKVVKVKIIDALPWGLKGTLESFNCEEITRSKATGS